MMTMGELSPLTYNHHTNLNLPKQLVSQVQRVHQKHKSFEYITSYYIGYYKHCACF